MKIPIQTGDSNCALVVLYNHNYEKNIDKIRGIYSDRFSEIFQIMPFYYGNDCSVIPVHGNSHQFHSFIAQARTRLLGSGYDRFLFIGDDVLLNPTINETNVCEQLCAQGEASYLDGFINVNDGNSRAVVEAHSFQTHSRGIMDSINDFLPPYDEAFRILHEQGKITSTVINTYKPFYQSWVKPSFHNHWMLRERLVKLSKILQYRICPKKMPYPCVFGYSDVFMIHKSNLTTFCRYLEIFTSWRMFVELAIPTAFSLMPGHQVSTIDKTKYKAGNVWFPQTPEHYFRMTRVIADLAKDSEYKADKLASSFPSEFLYLHPVKLSKYT